MSEKLGVSYPLRVDASISLDRIAEAAEVIDPVFLDTPQFLCEPLSDRFGVAVVLKVECINPIRSFKGRGTDYLLYRLARAPLGVRGLSVCTCLRHSADCASM